MKLEIYSPFTFGSMSGRTKVSRTLALELNKLDIDVRLLDTKIMSYDGILPKPDYDLLIDFTKKDFTPDIVLSLSPYKSSFDCKHIGMFLDIYNSIPDTLDFDNLDEVWVPSKNAYDLILKSKKVTKKKLYYIPFGVDTNTFKPDKRTISISDELKTKFDFVYGFMGDYTMRKGIDIVLQSHYEMFSKDSNVALFIKGDLFGAKYILKDTQAIESKSDNKDFATVVYSFNSFKDTELAAIYRALDLFVFPSRGEWFGLSPLEAMSSGIPTITTSTSAMKDFAGNTLSIEPTEQKSIPTLESLDEKYKGVLFDEPNREQYKKLVLDVYNKKIDTKPITNKARDFVVNNYSYEVVYSNMKDRLTTLLES